MITGQFRSTYSISIHALQAECDVSQNHSLDSSRISIHALQAECDRNHSFQMSQYARFLSTHSKRSATGNARTSYSFTNISIHALQAECDCILTRSSCIARQYFYPRTPSGVRLLKLLKSKLILLISIHALQAECDYNLPC